MKLFKIFIVVGVSLLFSCTGSKELVDIKNSDDIELQYMHLFTEATKHSLLGNYKLAVQLYTNCIQLKPESNAPFYQLSNIFMKAGDIESAISYGEKAYTNCDTNIWYALHLANLYQYNKDAKSSIKMYEAIVKMDPNEEYYYNLALLYTRDKKYESALAVIDSLSKATKNSKELFLLRHNIYNSKGESDNAVKELEKLISYFPENYENYGLLAEYLSELDRNGYAQEVYWKLNKLMPNSGLVKISYADFLIKNNRNTDSAYVYYKESLLTDDISLDDKINLVYSVVERHQIMDSVFIANMIDIYKTNYSNDSRIYSVSADYYIKKGKYELARNDLENYIKEDSTNEIVWEQFLLLENFLGNDFTLLTYAKKAIKLFPDRSNYLLMKAFAEYGLNRYDSCKSTCSKGLAIVIDQDEKIQFYILLADCHRELKEYTMSDLYYEKIIEDDPYNMMIKNNYSYYLSIRDANLERAEKLSSETIKKDPTNATYLDTYGWILYKLGKYEAALKYIQNAIKYGANENAEVLEHYGDIMIKLERCNEAIEAWHEAIKFSENKIELEKKINNWNESCH